MRYASAIHYPDQIGPIHRIDPLSGPNGYDTPLWSIIPTGTIHHIDPLSRPNRYDTPHWSIIPTKKVRYTTLIHYPDQIGTIHLIDPLSRPNPVIMDSWSPLYSTIGWILRYTCLWTWRKLTKESWQRSACVVCACSPDSIICESTLKLLFTGHNFFLFKVGLLSSIDLSQNTINFYPSWDTATKVGH